ncbi:MAG: hypothetical protein NC236_00065 [Mycoplasma sp.]|nr:hypothetical protein [Mycoplasma sp.]
MGALVNQINDAKTPEENRQANKGVFRAIGGSIILDVSKLDGTTHMYRAKWEASSPPSQTIATDDVWEDLGTLPSNESMNVALGVVNLQAKERADANTSPLIYTYNEDGTPIDSGNTESKSWNEYSWGNILIAAYVPMKIYWGGDIVQFESGLWQAKQWTNKSPVEANTLWIRIGSI